MLARPENILSSSFAGGGSFCPCSMCTGTHACAQARMHQACPSFCSCLFSSLFFCVCVCGVGGDWLTCSCGAKQSPVGAKWRVPRKGPRRRHARMATPFDSSLLILLRVLGIGWLGVPVRLGQGLWSQARYPFSPNCHRELKKSADFGCCQYSTCKLQQPAATTGLVPIRTSTVNQSGIAS